MYAYSLVVSDNSTIRATINTKLRAGTNVNVILLAVMNRSVSRLLEERSSKLIRIVRIDWRGISSQLWIQTCPRLVVVARIELSLLRGRELAVESGEGDMYR